MAMSFSLSKAGGIETSGKSGVTAKREVAMRELRPRDYKVVLLKLVVSILFSCLSFIRRLVYRYKHNFLLLAIFIVSFIVALMLHDKLKLPFSNPWRVVSQMTIAKYNPTNDVIRFVFLVMTPSAVIAIIFLNRFTRGWVGAKTRGVLDFKNISIDNRLTKRIIYVLIFVILFAIIGNYSVYPQIFHKPPWVNRAELDTFHEGETLGAAIDYLNGKVPYKDTIFFHGSFQDPLRSILAFKVFGKSIAAVRTGDSMLNIVTLLLFFTVLYFLYDKNIYFTCISFFLLLLISLTSPWGLGFYLKHRVIVMFIFIILAVFIRKVIITGSYKNHKLSTHILLFLFTFVSSSGFAYSVDVGFFTFAASVISVVIIYPVFLRKADVKYIFSILAGYISGVILLGITIRWAYYDFAKFTFIILPQYKDLIDGLIYLFKERAFLVPVVLISVCMYWLAYRFGNLIATTKAHFLEKFKLFYSTYFMEILLLILSIFCFKIPLSRSDVSHIQAWSWPIFILVFYILSKHFFLPYLNRAKYKNQICFIACIIVMFVFVKSYLPKVNWQKLYRFQPSRADREYIPESYAEAIFFLKNNLKVNESFFSLTSEPIWYYFIDKPCPCRFSILWFALPRFYQEEMVEDLKRNNVKYILYRSNHWANTFENIDKHSRVPLVMQYINRNYRPSVTIGDKEIVVRKSGEN